MKKGFLAGFVLSLAVVLLPTFYYMDARSSSDRQGKTEVSAEPPDLFPGNPKRDPSPSATRATDPALAPIPSSPASPGPSPAPDADVLAPSSPKGEPAGEIVMLKKPMPVQAFPPPAPVRPEGGIRTRVYDPDRIYTLRTAVSHVTLVDLPEDAKEVYMGDSKLFLAEVFGKRVKVKPITYNPDYPFPDPSGSVFRPGGNFPACQSPLQGGPLLDRQRVKGEMVEAFREKGLRLLEKSVFRKAFSSGDEVHRDGPGKMIPYELQKTYRLENVHRTA